MPGKPNPLGEDAFLQLPSSTTHRGGAAVFDGVGGWYYSGVDPRVYATGLSEEVAKGIEEVGSMSGKELVNVLHEASTSMDRRGIVGGTTACVCVLDAGGDSADHGVLHIANIGDSGAIVFRDGELVFSTTPSMNDATCPKQLGTRANPAACADTFAFDVMRGDVLVCATDGLLDNINKTRIGQLVHSKRHAAPLEIAEEIGSEAYNAVCGRNSFVGTSNAPIRTPQAGGRPDDITIIVAHLVAEKPAEPKSNVVLVQHRGVGKL